MIIINSKTSIMLCVLIISFATGVFAKSETVPIGDRVVINKMFEIYNLDTVNIEIEVLKNPFSDNDINADQLTIRALTQKEPIGLFTIMAEIRDINGKTQSRQIHLRIRKFDSVLVAVDRVSRHDNLTHDNFELRRMEVTTLREMPLHKYSDLEQHRAKRNLRRGKVLTSGDIEPVPIVQCGRDISIVYDDGPCLITAVGTVLQSGLPGDYIRIKNKTSGKTILAKVIDNKSAVVDP